MLLKSIVKRTLGLKRHCVKAIQERNERIIIELEDRKKWCLPYEACGTLATVRDHLVERNWRHVPLWEMRSEIRYRPARVCCPQ